MLPIFIIVAVDLNNGMGYKGKLPWHLPKDLAYFQKVTTQTKDPAKKNMVIMGRTTWESLPESFRPLPGRVNIVLTSNCGYQAKGAEVRHTLEEAVSFGLMSEEIDSVFIIGGAKVFNESLAKNFVNGIYLTRINSVYECDTFFPEIPKKFSIKEKIAKGNDAGVEFEFWKYGKLASSF